MPVQTTLNLPVRKTRSRTKASPAAAAELAVGLELELPTKGRRQRQQQQQQQQLQQSPSKRQSKRTQDEKDHGVDSFQQEPQQKIHDPATPSTNPSDSPKKSKREQTNENPVAISTKLNLNASPTKVKEHKENGVAINGSEGRKLTMTKADSSLYSKARHSLHTQLTDAIIGRDTEIRALRELVEPSIRDGKAVSLYISGAPGTGKTVSLTYVLDSLSGEYKFRSVFINCMTVKTVSSIYSKIADGLAFASDGLDGVQQGVRKSPCVIVLDEIDQLQSHNQQVLYSLFELVKLKDSKVVLVGIANALDLTDKTVPLLQAYGCRPQLYHFAPYSDKQIIAILKSRLADCSAVIKPMALAFLAKKIATCTGDVRKALDICRRAVEIVERQVRQQRILAARAAAPSGASPQKPVLVDIGHISQVLSDVFNTRARGNQDLHSTLPLQQKLLLCSILVFMKRRKLKEVSLGKLHEVYGRVCKVAKVAPIDYSELQSICTLLEARALVSIKKAKESRQSKVSLAVDDAEIEQVLQDKSILATCLDETTAVC